MAQVFTGHGCFGEYLSRIGKEVTPRCHHCNSDLDTADHTLSQCPAWAEERERLREEIGDELFLSKIVEIILKREEAWQSFATFCGAVMRRKEDAERVRRGEQPPPANPPPNAN